MAATRTVYECSLCLRTFNSAGEKDGHCLEHIEQENCTKCNQNLIHFGGKFYTLHDRVTCVKRELDDYLPLCTEEIYLKSEPVDEFELHFENPNDSHQSVTNQESVKESVVSSAVSNLVIDNALIISDKRSKREKCDECEESFGRKRSLQRHKLIAHNSSGEYFCKICLKTFPTADELTGHKAIRAWRRNNQDMITFGGFECDICGAKLKNKEVLRGHMRWKHNPNARRFKCEICGSTFVRKSLLDIHHKRTHLNIREYVCSTCGKSFKTKDQLQSHSYKHTGEKPLQCFNEQCEKRFRTRANREQHMRVHTGERPFKCPVDGCGQQFAYASVLARHKIHVHEMFTKEFRCQICGDVFPENSILRKHSEQEHDVMI